MAWRGADEASPKLFKFSSSPDISNDTADRSNDCAENKNNPTSNQSIDNKISHNKTPLDNLYTDRDKTSSELRTLAEKFRGVSDEAANNSPDSSTSNQNSKNNPTSNQSIDNKISHNKTPLDNLYTDRDKTSSELRTLAEKFRGVSDEAANNSPDSSDDSKGNKTNSNIRDNSKHKNPSNLDTDSITQNTDNPKSDGRHRRTPVASGVHNTVATPVTFFKS